MITSSEFNIGAEIIEHMINVQHPLIMVDKITEYNSQKGIFRSKKYISANEPVFEGHFPDFKLWPGILTIEGLRQSALLYLAMRNIEDNDLLAGISQLQLQMTLVSYADNALSKKTIKHLKQLRLTVQNTFDIRIKLVAPVFSGCVIDYEIRQGKENIEVLLAKAYVNQRIVAEGTIKL